MSVFVVERYWTGVTGEDLAGLAARLRAATAVHASVRYLGSVLLVGDDVVQCRFEARDADAIRRLNDEAGLAYDRILLAQLPAGAVGEQGS